MASIIVSVADAVKSIVADATFSESLTLGQEVTPDRNYADWSLPLNSEDGNALRIDVVPVYHKIKTTQLTKGKLQYTVPIDICVRKKIEEGEQNDETGRASISVVDALLELTEQIHELFIPVRMASFDAATWMSTELLRMPHVPHLKENKQFTSIVRVSFKASRTIT